MKQKLVIALVAVLALVACEKDIRNIAPIPPSPEPTTPTVMEEVIPIDINEKGFEFLEKMQGHWVGSNHIIADDWEWFSFDFRALSSSIVHGMFEGGSMGNLFTSFFVTDYKEKRTLMARNGGVLNGIYRTSYFVLDSVRNDSEGDFYRFVDAIGGTSVMWMELRFVSDSLYFNVYTSRLGLFEPTRHMTFKGKKEHLDLAQDAAIATGFPQNVSAWDFSDGFNEEYLYTNSGDTAPVSATFMWEDQNASIVDLAMSAGDPWRIDQYPRAAYLDINIERTAETEDKMLFVNLSKNPLTDAAGYLSMNEADWNSILQFPMLTEGENHTAITYLHPGEYYLTVIADVNGDFAPGQGDMTHPSQLITITEEGQQSVTINNITIQN